jgi:hypothetical protein
MNPPKPRWRSTDNVDVAVYRGPDGYVIGSVSTSEPSYVGGGTHATAICRPRWILSTVYPSLTLAILAADAICNFIRAGVKS